MPSWNPITQATFMESSLGRDWTARGTKRRRTQTAWEGQSSRLWWGGEIHTPKEYCLASLQRVVIWEGAASSFRRVWSM